MLLPAARNDIVGACGFVDECCRPGLLQRTQPSMRRDPGIDQEHALSEMSEVCRVSSASNGPYVGIGFHAE